MVRNISGKQANCSDGIRKHQNLRHDYSPEALHEYHQEHHQSFYQRTGRPTKSRLILKESIKDESEK